MCSTLLIDEILPVIVCQNSIIVGGSETVDKEVLRDLSPSLYRRGSAVKKAGFSQIIQIFGCGDIIYVSGKTSHSGLSTGSDLGRASPSSLGCENHHTSCSLGSINRGGSRPPQHLNRLNITRNNGVPPGCTSLCGLSFARERDTLHNKQQLCGPINPTPTPNCNPDCPTRVT